MSIDGLRAWIGEVERKLSMRTRVFLVLAVIAIGGAGAAIYLSQDARSNSVSESDVQELQEQLEGQIRQVGAAAGTGGAGLSGLEAEVAELRSKVRELSREGGSAGRKGEAEPQAKGKEEGEAKNQP